MTPPKSDIALIRLHYYGTFDHDDVDRLIEGIALHAASERKELRAKADEIANSTEIDDDDKQLRQDSLGDDDYFLKELVKLGDELSIVALFKKMEITTKVAISVAFPTLNTSKFFKAAALKRALAARKIDIESLPNYKAMDELRCLNNNIKHSGTVGTELARYAGWTKGHPLKDLNRPYQRLAPKCVSYMRELVDELIKKRVNP